MASIKLEDKDLQVLKTAAGGYDEIDLDLEMELAQIENEAFGVSIRMNKDDN
jgi:hypothetical protein